MGLFSGSKVSAYFRQTFVAGIALLATLDPIQGFCKNYTVYIQVFLPSLARSAGAKQRDFPASSGIDDCATYADASKCPQVTFDPKAPESVASGTALPNGGHTGIPSGNAAFITIDLTSASGLLRRLDQQNFETFFIHTERFARAHEALALSARLFQRGLQIAPPTYGATYPVTIGVEVNADVLLDIPDSDNPRVSPSSPTASCSGSSAPADCAQTLVIPLPDPNLWSVTSFADKSYYLLKQSQLYDEADKILMLAQSQHLDVVNKVLNNPAAPASPVMTYPFPPTVAFDDITK